MLWPLRFHLSAKPEPAGQDNVGMPLSENVGFDLGIVPYRLCLMADNNLDLRKSSKVALQSLKYQLNRF